MADLLTAEERQALRAAAAPTSDIRPAEFPSVSDLDSASLASMEASLHEWLGEAAREVEDQLRLRCTPGRIEAGTRLPDASADDEVAIDAVLLGKGDFRIRIVVPGAFAAALCERMFGGPMAIAGARPLTPTELRALTALAETWLRWMPSAFPLGPGATTAYPADPDRAAPPYWLSFTAELDCAGSPAVITVLMESSAARALLGQSPLTDRGPVSGREILKVLGGVDIDLHVVVGSAATTLDSLCNLRVGDIITLDRRIDEPFDVMLDGRMFVRANAADTGKAISLTVTEFVSEEGED